MIKLEDIPTITLADLKDGDGLLQLADDSWFGEGVKLLASKDAEAKGVPLCQHVRIRVSEDGVPKILESSWFVTLTDQSQAFLEKETYIVVRHSQATPEGVVQATQWGVARVGDAYGYANLARVGVNLVTGLHLPGQPDERYEICSEFYGEFCGHGGFPVEHPDDTCDLKPWDYLCPPLMNPGPMVIVGKLVF